MDIREKVYSFIRMRGPVLPIEVARYIEKDLLLTSAMLADLTASKKIRISNIKVGQSKLYYAPGQEPKLQEYSKHLNQKDLQTYQMLKEKKVFREKALEPLTRVSVRQLKDFARPLEVNANGTKEIFWKWYLTTNEDATKIIKDMLGMNKPKQVEVKKPETVEVDRQEEPKTQSPATQKKAEEPEKEPEQPKRPEPKQAKKPEQPKQPPAQTRQPQKKEPAERQDTIHEEITDQFGKEVKKAFDSKRIRIIKHAVQRKNSDIDLEVRIPSPAGELLYYCKAKKKQRVSDSDLASAFVEGQMRKLPVLFATTGKLTKKAQEKMGKEFSSVTVMEV